MRVAAVQAEPVWLDLQGGVNKVCALIKDAGSKGVQVLGFPETFIPGFPMGLYTTSPKTEWVLRYQKNSLVVDSPEYEQILQAAHEAGIWVVLGFSERVRSTLFMAQSIINPAGKAVLHRRKLKPTHVERYLWGDGQAEDLNTVVQMESGANLGALNCWEHLQPLLRYHHYAQGVDLHVASWPQQLPEGPDTAGRFASTSTASRDVISRLAAIEGGMFVLVCTAVTSAEGSKTMNVEIDSETPGCVPVQGGGFSAIFGPDGSLLAKATDDTNEQLVIADIDLDDIHRHKQMADCVGHYSRPDLLSLNVTKGSMPRVKFHKL